MTAQKGFTKRIIVTSPSTLVPSGPTAVLLPGSPSLSRDWGPDPEALLSPASEDYLPESGGPQMPCLGAGPCCPSPQAAAPWPACDRRASSPSKSVPVRGRGYSSPRPVPRPPSRPALLGLTSDLGPKCCPPHAALRKTTPCKPRRFASRGEPEASSLSARETGVKQLGQFLPAGGRPFTSMAMNVPEHPTLINQLPAAFRRAGLLTTLRRRQVTHASPRVSDGR